MATTFRLWGIISELAFPDEEVGGGPIADTGNILTWHMDREGGGEGTQSWVTTGVTR